MDYKKKYKEALEWAKQIKDGKIGVVIDDLVEKFPELKENEDERIRKEIIQFLQLPHPQFVGKRNHEEWISWLEKQGNISPTKDELEALRIAAYEPTKNWSEKLQSLYEKLARCEQGEQKPVISEYALREGIVHFGITQYQIDNWLKKYVYVEKQGEQKDTNKIEPKFKVGDWVVYKENVYQIHNISLKKYYECLGIDGTVHIFDFEYFDSKSHIWTIRDAKDGDVLHTSSTASHETFIFKGLSKEGNIECYCSYDSEDKYRNGKYHFIGEPTFKTHPATKEQRELLFQKMKEVGYEWDAEKKELKKIEQTFADKKYTFNVIPRLLSMIQPTDRAKAYCQKLIDILIQEGYDADAKIVDNSLKQMNGEKVSMTTMDEQKPTEIPMTLDEAIAHCEHKACGNSACALEHKQLAQWLTELKEYNKQNPVEPVTVVERDGEKWVRVCALGEDFIIAAHDYRDGDKAEFTWEEACNIGTFSKKQGYIILALMDEINARLREIGGEPLSSHYWSSSESYQPNAWVVNFNSGYVYTYSCKYGSLVAREVIAF